MPLVLILSHSELFILILMISLSNKSRFFLQWNSSNYLRCPQGLILGSLLFNVNLIDFFLGKYYKLGFSSYADGITSYDCRSTFLETMSDLEITLDKLFNWFCYNNFKANASKCHLFLLPFNAKSINIKSSLIEGSEKFLAITWALQ